MINKKKEASRLKSKTKACTDTKKTKSEKNLTWLRSTAFIQCDNEPERTL